MTSDFFIYMGFGKIKGNVCWNLMEIVSFYSSHCLYIWPTAKPKKLKSETHFQVPDPSLSNITNNHIFFFRKKVRYIAWSECPIKGLGYDVFITYLSGNVMVLLLYSVQVNLFRPQRNFLKYVSTYRCS